MKTTMKLALLASAMMIASTASANDYKRHKNAEKRDGHYNSQSARVAANEREAMRYNQHQPSTGYERRGETRYLGMKATTAGMKDGFDNDMNNRSKHSFVMGRKASNVVKH